MIGLNRVKTWILIAALGGLFVLIGGAIGGQQGAILALGIALVFNFSMYWFSDKIAIATTRSKPVTEQEAPELYRIVRELTQLNQMPMPRIYVSDMMQPNAFATGRNPQHAVVAVTRGILEILDEHHEAAGYRSAGQEQVVALSLIAALNRNARRRAPVIMDTPFGRLDAEHSQNILRFLSEMAEQVFLLVHDRVIVYPQMAGGK